MFPFVYEINLAGWFHLLYFGLVIPVSAIIQSNKFKKAEQPLPNRLRHFHRTTATLVMFGAISLLVARSESIELFPRFMPTPRALLTGVLMFVVAVLLMRPRWRRAVERRARVVHLFMPANASERAWWIAVAVMAGISEEITWRGVQAGLAGSLTGSFWIAALLCAISFGVGHVIQGWRSVVVVFMFAFGFHMLVWLSGSLYVAMAVHIAYDITAGINYGRLGRELGYSLDPAAATSPHAAETGGDSV